MTRFAKRGRTSRGVALASAALLGLSLAACGDSGSSESPASQQETLETVKIGIVPTVNTAMAHLAVHQDLGEEFGIDLESTTISGAGSTNQVAALLSGDLDVAIGGTNTVIDAIAEGADLKVVGGISPLNFSIVLNKKVADGLGVSADASTEEKIRALKGLNIAASPPGSTGNSVLRTILEDAGLDPDRDVSVVPITDLGAIPSGINRGTYDASFVAVGAGEVSVASGDGVLWLSIPRGDFDVLEGYLGVVSFTSTRYAEENPELVEATHNAFEAAQEMTSENPDEVARILKDTIFAELDQPVFDEAWSQVQDAYPAGMDFTQDHWETFVELFDDTSEKDYASLNYEDFTTEPARGE